MTQPQAAEENEGAGTVVHCFKKNAREAICAGTSEWKGEVRIFIRTYVSSLEGDDLIPTRKGISLPKGEYHQLIQGLKAIADVATEQVVAKIRKSQRHEVWVSYSLFKNIPLVNIRTYVRQRDERDWRPTQQGVSVRLEQYQELLEAVEKLGEHLGVRPTE